MLHPRTIACSVLLPMLLHLSVGASAQELLLVPKWRKDDTRTIYLTEISRTAENGAVTQERSMGQTARARVVDVQPEHYMLNVEHRNVVVHEAKALSQKLGGDMDPWKNLLLRYRVDRRKGAMDFFNWEEVRDALHSSYEQVKRSIRKNDPELLDTLELMMQPVLALYSDQERITDHFKEQFGFLTFAFGRSMTLGTTMRIDKQFPSPYQEGDTLMSTTLIRLDGYDPETDRATIRIEEISDPALLVEHKQRLMMEVAGDLSVDAEGMILSEKEIKQHLDAAAMSMTQVEVITLDMETGWPTRLVRERDAILKVAGRESVNSAIFSVEVR